MNHVSNTARFFIIASHHYWLENRLDKRVHLQQEDALIGFEHESALQEDERNDHVFELDA